MKKNKLICVFLVIVIVKIFLSLQFSTPFIFQDEYSYGYLAKNIMLDYKVVINIDAQYSSGYPLLLSPSFMIFYPNMDRVYRSVLTTNIILLTSILFISYFILKKFVREDIAIFGSVLITLLPSNTLYNFLIFSENLYIPLYVLSGYLVLKSLGKNDKFLHVITGIVMFHLTIIRVFGIFAYISFFVTILYSIYEEKNHRLEFIKKNRYLIFTPIILLGIWNILKKVYDSNLYGYDDSAYLQSLTYIFGNIQHFILFLKLAIHEIDYLIITSYIVFFIFFILIFFYWKELDKNIRIYVIYSTMYAILSLVLTVLHMMNVVKNPDSQAYMYYFIFGRYLDPVLPTMFIIGLVFWNIFLHKNHILKSDIKKFIYIAILTTSVLVITYPYYTLYKFPNVLSIYYLKDVPYAIFVLSILLLFMVKVLFKRPKTLITVLIALSILVSISPYVQLKTTSNWMESANDIGRFLSNEREENVLFDKEVFDDYMTYLTKFWAMPNNLIYESNITNSTNMMNIKYIVTRKSLPYEVVLLSSDNILYKNNIFHDVQIIPTIGFYAPKYGNNRIYNTWMENNAILYVYTRNASNESLTIKTASFYKPRNLQMYLNGELINEKNITTNVTDTNIRLILNSGENKIRFYTPNKCIRPIDIAYNTDTRCISIYFQEISLSGD